jgi:hypothetical protein
VNPVPNEVTWKHLSVGVLTVKNHYARTVQRITLWTSLLYTCGETRPNIPCSIWHHDQRRSIRMVIPHASDRIGPNEVTWKHLSVGVLTVKNHYARTVQRITKSWSCRQVTILLTYLKSRRMQNYDNSLWSLWCFFAHYIYLVRILSLIGGYIIIIWWARYNYLMNTLLLFD